MSAAVTNEDIERAAFESAVHDYYLAKRAAVGQLPNDTEMPCDREGLCWRLPDGKYGVGQVESAWWGWKTRALLTRVMRAAS